MAILVEEHFDSRVSEIGRQSSVELRYILRSDPPAPFDDVEARNALLAVIPTEYDPWGLGVFYLLRKSITLRPTGYHTWEALVRYGQAEALPRVFDTSGGTQHIVASRQTVGRYGPRASAFTGKMIGATKDGVDGVDIVVPVHQFSETHIFNDDDITPPYKAAVARLTGTVNNMTFREFAKGECLFLGVSGTRRGDGNWELVFRFAVSPNQTNLEVGEITGITKRGWDYLWIRTEDDVDEAIACMIKRPVAVYVEQVYEYANWTPLEI